MQTLIIVPPSVRPELEKTLASIDDVHWASGLIEAKSALAETDFDLVVFDARCQIAQPALKELIGQMPFTARLMAIVDHLPDEQIFSESGVVYLTPPVHLGDVTGFIRNLETQYA